MNTCSMKANRYPPSTTKMITLIETISKLISISASAIVSVKCRSM